MGQVAKRYAKALFLASGQEVTLIQKDLEVLTDLTQHSPEWRAFIKNPLYTHSQLLLVIPKVSKSLKLHAITEKFLRVLATHGRLKHLSAILHESITYFNYQRGQKLAEVKSMYPLSQQVQGKISTYLSQKFKGEVHVKNIIDSKVLGGVSIQVESNLFDATIRTQLNSIQRQLREA